MILKHFNRNHYLFYPPYFVSYSLLFLFLNLPFTRDRVLAATFLCFPLGSPKKEVGERHEAEMCGVRFLNLSIAFLSRYSFRKTTDPYEACKVILRKICLLMIEPVFKAITRVN